MPEAQGRQARQRQQPLWQPAQLVVLQPQRPAGETSGGSTKPGCIPRERREINYAVKSLGSGLVEPKLL